MIQILTVDVAQGFQSNTKILIFYLNSWLVSNLNIFVVKFRRRRKWFRIQHNHDIGMWTFLLKKHCYLQCNGIIKLHFSFTITLIFVMLVMSSKATQNLVRIMKDIGTNRHEYCTKCIRRMNALKSWYVLAVTSR